MVSNAASWLLLVRGEAGRRGLVYTRPAERDSAVEEEGKEVARRAQVLQFVVCFDLVATQSL